MTVLTAILKATAVVTPIGIVAVVLINELQASRAVVLLVVFLLASAGAVLGALFDPESRSR